MDKSEREARTKPRHHQPVPNQYRTWWGHGPEVRGKAGMVWWSGEGKRSIYGSCPSLFWEVRPAGMIDHPKEASLRGDRRVHALRVERESINTVAGRNVTVYRGTKQTRLCLARVDVAQSWWSASTPRPDKGG